MIFRRRRRTRLDEFSARENWSDPLSRQESEILETAPGSDHSPFDLEEVQAPEDLVPPAPEEILAVEVIEGPDPRVDLLNSRIEFLVDLVQSRARFDETRELQVKKLYDELDAYKRDAHSDRLLDLARAVMVVIDRLSGDSSAAIPNDLIREELIEHLASVGVTRIAGPVGSLGPPIEVVVRLLDPDDAESVRMVQEGYEYNGRIIRPRQVEQKGIN